MKVLKRQEKDMDIHVVCDKSIVTVSDGALVSAIKHTIKIFVYILLISLVLNMVIEFIGEDTLASLFLDAGGG